MFSEESPFVSAKIGDLLHSTAVLKPFFCPITSDTCKTKWPFTCYTRRTKSASDTLQCEMTSSVNQHHFGTYSCLDAKGDVLQCINMQNMCQMISHGAPPYYEWLTLYMIFIVRLKCLPILHLTENMDFHLRSETSNDKCAMRWGTVWSCQTWHTSKFPWPVFLPIPIRHMVSNKRIM